jgi:hypothetical protein
MSIFKRKPKDSRSFEDIVGSQESEKDTVCEEAEGVEQDNANSETCAINDVPLKAIDCFGMDEVKTEKWMLKCVNIWYYIMSFLWFMFGVCTFAPVIFISNKVNVIFRDKKKSLICGIVLHSVLVALIIAFFISRHAELPPPAVN